MVFFNTSIKCGHVSWLTCGLITHKILNHYHPSPWIIATNYHYSSHWFSTVLWPPIVGVYPKEMARSKMYMNEKKTAQAHIKTNIYFIWLTYIHTFEFPTNRKLKLQAWGIMLIIIFFQWTAFVCVWQRLKPSQPKPTSLAQKNHPKEHFAKTNFMLNKNKSNSRT
jgi:hypothetical protein